MARGPTGLVDPRRPPRRPCRPRNSTTGPSTKSLITSSTASSRVSEPKSPSVAAAVRAVGVHDPSPAARTRDGGDPDPLTSDNGTPGTDTRTRRLKERIRAVRRRHPRRRPGPDASATTAPSSSASVHPATRARSRTTRYRSGSVTREYSSSLASLPCRGWGSATTRPIGRRVDGGDPFARGLGHGDQLTTVGAPSSEIGAAAPRRRASVRDCGGESSPTPNLAADGEQPGAQARRWPILWRGWRLLAASRRDAESSVVGDGEPVVE